MKVGRDWLFPTQRLAAPRWECAIIRGGNLSTTETSKASHQREAVYQVGPAIQKANAVHSDKAESEPESVTLSA